MINVLLVLLIIGSLYILAQGVKSVITKKTNLKNMSIIVSSISLLVTSSVLFSIY